MADDLNSDMRTFLHASKRQQDIWHGAVDTFVAKLPGKDQPQFQLDLSCEIDMVRAAFMHTLRHHLAWTDFKNLTLWPLSQVSEFSPLEEAVTVPYSHNVDMILVSLLF